MATHSLAVLFLDVDRFQLINDSLGHATGDDLLRAIAARLTASLGSDIAVARLAGDEFVVLLEGVDADRALGTAEYLQSAVAASFNVRQQEIFLTVSVGVATSGSAEHPDDLLRNADVAMHRAKSIGRSRVELFDQAMRVRAVAQLYLETDLRRAVERDEFAVYYQPVIEVSSGRITGFDAPVRWLHPDRGVVVTEGFETEAQLDELKRLRCTYAQGFLFSRPMAHEAVE